MPYVKQIDRLDLLDGKTPVSAGELNFKITMCVVEYMQDKKISYEFLNSIVGALEAAKLEFYRRVLVPYEDRKITENGDVYP